MHYRHSDTVEAEVVPAAVKILIAGGFGAGKTTILKTVSGVMDPQKGSVTLEGRPIHGLDPDQPVDRARTLEEVRSEAIASPRLTSILLSIFAALATAMENRSPQRSSPLPMNSPLPPASSWKSPKALRWC